MIIEKHNNRVQKKPKRRCWRFSLRSLFWITAIVAAIVYIPTMLHQVYYWELTHVRAVLATHQEIEDVRIEGFDDITYEVEQVAFSIAGKPGSKVELLVRHAERIDDGNELCLLQIGPWRFSTFGNGYVGATRMDTGEPVKSYFYSPAIDVGSEGPFAELIPIKAKSIADIVANYDELIAFFQTWPNERKPGIVQDRSGILLHYYATHTSQ